MPLDYSLLVDLAIYRGNLQLAEIIRAGEVDLLIAAIHDAANHLRPVGVPNDDLIEIDMEDGEGGAA